LKKIKFPIITVTESAANLKVVIVKTCYSFNSWLAGLYLFLGNVKASVYKQEFTC